MTKKGKIKNILSLLDIHYPIDTKCYLDYSKPYELLIATILSAQCTDDRVNLVTKDLFQKYPSLESFAKAYQIELEKDVHSTGFFRQKAKNIILSANRLINEHNGEVPSDIDILTSLPGVGRKTANVVRGHIFGIHCIVVDTHVKRVSNKFGLVSSDDPEKIEFELMRILPKRHWIRYNAQVIAHGRAICKAQKPACDVCFLSHNCSYALSHAIIHTKRTK